MFYTNAIILAFGLKVAFTSADNKDDTYYKEADTYPRFEKQIYSNRRFNKTVDSEYKYITEVKVAATDNGTEECVGLKDYCNMTEEEYVNMLNNYIFPDTYEWVIIGIHAIVFIVGLLGNALVCVAIFKNRAMRTVTNYFIVNLAVADFMVILFCLPATVVWDVTETWFFGNALCKTLLYFQSVSVMVSVLTLSFISVDRWYAICLPLKCKSTKRRTGTAVIVIWIIALAFNVPELIMLTTSTNVPLRFGVKYFTQCSAIWSETTDLVWDTIKVLLIYTLPLLLMTVAYIQIIIVLWRSENILGRAVSAELTAAELTQLHSRRKAAKMLVALVIVFAVCYFPVHLLLVLRHAVEMKEEQQGYLALLSHLMCFSNSAINPMIYNFLSEKFCREFRSAFRCSTAANLENFNLRTRNNTSKKRRSDLMTFESGAQEKNICSTSFI